MGAKRRYPVGTVLCSCSCNMGATAIVRAPLISNQTFIGITPLPSMEPEFVFYAMQDAKTHLTTIATGAIQQYLSRNDFSRLRVPLPPLLEQRAIAAFLDHETARIDSLIEKVDDGMNKLKEYRTALISAAVTGKIDVREEVD
ncbi:restriction endonuclease subunit S [Bacteroidota bacterium]